MQFYKTIVVDSDTKPEYLCTRDEAHKRTKNFPEYARRDARIELVEIATDKATLAGVLSGWGCSETVLRTWRLTPRGGLVECPTGE